MEYINTSVNDFSCVEDGSGRGRRSQSKYVNDNTVQFKSKNLEAERKRRHKLNERLINLRALVPLITNMNKATIIDDAITYITGLQKHVKGLSEQLMEMETEEGQKQEHVGAAVQETEKIDIELQADVQITYLDEHRLWFKILCESKRGRFTKMMEIIHNLGFDITDINFTASSGATLIIFSVKVKDPEKVAVDQLRKYLLQIIGESSEKRQCY